MLEIAAVMVKAAVAFCVIEPVAVWVDLPPMSWVTSLVTFCLRSPPMVWLYAPPTVWL